MLGSAGAPSGGPEPRREDAGPVRDRSGRDAIGVALLDGVVLLDGVLPALDGAARRLVHDHLADDDMVAFPRAGDDHRLIADGLAADDVAGLVDEGRLVA